MTRRRVNPELLRNLVNASEIARRAGVQRSAVSNWSARGVGFPEPVVRLMYDWREVDAWLRETHRHPKPQANRSDTVTVSRPVDDHRFAPRPWR